MKMNEKYIDGITKKQDMLKEKKRCEKKTDIYNPNKLQQKKKTKSNTAERDFGKVLQGLGKGLNKTDNKATVPAFSFLVHLLSVSLHTD